MINRRPDPTGFTLLELLLVLLIIGLGVGVASLSLRDARGTDDLDAAARQLVSGATLAAEEGVLGGRQWGLRGFSTVDNGELRYGYQWLRLEQNTWRRAAPAEREAQVLLAPGVDMALQVEGESLDLQRAPAAPRQLSPDIWLQSNGEATPFSLTLRAGERSVRVEGDLLARFTVEH